MVNLDARCGERSTPLPCRLPSGMTRYPLYRSLGGPQNRYERVLKISPPPGFDPSTIQAVASKALKVVDHVTRVQQCPFDPCRNCVTVSRYPAQCLLTSQGAVTCS